MFNWQGIALMITIIVMMALVFQITRFLSNSPHGLYSSVIKAYLRGNEKRKEWIKEYNIYYWSVLLNVCLVVTILALCAALGQQTFLKRPEIALIVGIPLWYSIYKCTKWYQKKLKY